MSRDGHSPFQRRADELESRLAVNEIPYEVREAGALVHDFEILFYARDHAFNLGALRTMPVSLINASIFS
jgi:hypothetical protein